MLFTIPAAAHLHDQDQQQPSEIALPNSENPDNISPKTFPLATLGHKLKAVSEQLHEGTGFAVLRGLDPKKYSALENLLLYLGITSHVAEIRGCQDYDGRMVGKFVLQVILNVINIDSDYEIQRTPRIFAKMFETMESADPSRHTRLVPR